MGSMPRKKESFLLVNLQEDQAKHLAQIVSNDSCRKILDYLSDKENATETDISNSLAIPISTVHYNLQALVKGNLVEAEEFHYSEKGKEVLHYNLANKFIIIAPKSTFGLKEKLRSILPVGAVCLGAAAILQWFQKFLPTSVGESAAQPLMAATPLATNAGESMVESVPLLAKGAVESVSYDTANEIVVEGVNQSFTSQVVEVVKEPSFWQSSALWFLIGAVSALVLYLLFSYLFRKK